MPDVPRKIRNAVYTRDHNQCVACGSTTGLTLQHRINRGMGGSKYLDTPDNLITLCHHENTALESNALFALDGRAKGFKLYSYMTPADCPVLYVDGWYRLKPDGTRTPWQGPVPDMANGESGPVRWSRWGA
ncbi:HNH endonuclease signature motif containing protein [Rothia sp. LK2588]|uniref:HNH endonuclease n=1 Tax=Rothia sp. LK2588 TaxID=3114369 RepID=UPI0034CF32C9